MTWLVTHDFQQPIPVLHRLDAYPNLGVELEYNEAGSLIRILHRVNAKSNPEPSEVVQCSLQKLAAFLEVLEFYYGYTPRIGLQHANLCGVADQSVGLVTISVIAAIVHKVEFPAEATLQKASPRLVKQLHLFNMARQSTIDHVAVYLYYLIWEDLHQKAVPPNDTPEQRLKYTRDFVSHGITLDRPSAIKFIESRINKQLTAFDPLDPKHAAFVAAQREEARLLMEGKVGELLQG